MSTQPNQLTSLDDRQEGGGGSADTSLNFAPDISLREWYEGTRKILKERTSYKHRLDMVLTIGAEPLFK